MGTGPTFGLPASNASLSEPDRRFRRPDRHPDALESGTCEDEQAPKAGLVEFFDRIDQVPIERDAQATSLDPGVNRRVTLRRSVNVQESGGVMRSACSVHRE